MSQGEGAPDDDLLSRLLLRHCAFLQMRGSEALIWGLEVFLLGL
jgi:hypothetical protein